MPDTFLVDVTGPSGRNVGTYRLTYPAINQLRLTGYGIKSHCTWTWSYAAGSEVQNA